MAANSIFTDHRDRRKDRFSRAKCGETEAVERLPRDLGPAQEENENGGAAPTCTETEPGDQRLRLDSLLCVARDPTRRAPPRGRRTATTHGLGLESEPKPRPSPARSPLTPPLPFPCTPQSSPSPAQGTQTAKSHLLLQRRIPLTPSLPSFEEPPPAGLS